MSFVVIFSQTTTTPQQHHKHHTIFLRRCCLIFFFACSGTTLYGPAVVTATSIPLNLPEFGVKDYSLIRAVSQDCMTMNLQVKNQNGFPVAYEQIYNLVPTIFAMKDPFTVPNACLTSRMQRVSFFFLKFHVLLTE